MINQGPLIDVCASPTLTGRVRAHSPAVEILDNAIFVPKGAGVPFEKDNEWGLYYKDGSLCKAAAYRRGTKGELVGQSALMKISAKSISQAPEYLYVYAGVCHVHFGHMILGTICRLWSSLRASPSIKFIYHGDQNPVDWFKHPHFRDIMNAAGFDAQSFYQSIRMSSITTGDCACSKL